MERAVKSDGQSLAQLSFEELDSRWNAAKSQTATTTSTNTTKE
jgi:hypothetical protein